MSEPLITADLVLLDADLGATKTEVIRNLAALVGKTGRADTAGLASDALAREEKAVTGLGGGIAIPHCRSAAVNTNTLAFARLSPKVDCGAADGPADICFMIAASGGSDDAHLTLLAMLARSLMRSEFQMCIRDRLSTETGRLNELVSQIIALSRLQAADPMLAAHEVVPVSYTHLSADVP